MKNELSIEKNLFCFISVLQSWVLNVKTRLRKISDFPRVFLPKNPRKKTFRFLSKSTVSSFKFSVKFWRKIEKMSPFHQTVSNAATIWSRETYTDNWNNSNYLSLRQLTECIPSVSGKCHIRDWYLWYFDTCLLLSLIVWLNTAIMGTGSYTGN